MEEEEDDDDDDNAAAATTADFTKETKQNLIVLYHAERQWLTFDDFQYHTARNDSNENRVVLYLVIESMNEKI